MKNILIPILMGLLCFTACRENGPEPENTVMEEGYCGADTLNLSYRLYGDGRLVVSGSGKMVDYSRRPWSKLCHDITRVELEEGITDVGEGAFLDCDHLTAVTLPASVTAIGMYAFGRCPKLVSVTMGGGVTTIGAEAFTDCTALESISLPEGLTTIGFKSFYRSGLRALHLPEGCTLLGNSAFEQCTALAELSLPASLKTIGSQVFAGCTALTMVRTARATPLRINNYFFSGVDLSRATLTVPSGSRGLYMAASVWGSFGTIKE